MPAKAKRGEASSGIMEVEEEEEEMKKKKKKASRFDNNISVGNYGHRWLSWLSWLTGKTTNYDGEEVERFLLDACFVHFVRSFQIKRIIVGVALLSLFPSLALSLSQSVSQLVS